MSRVLRSALIAALLATAGGYTAASAECPEFADGVSAGVVMEPALPEASGLAASRANAGVIWAHNDSGSPAELFALSDNGSTLATYLPTPTTNFDWEDIAIGPGPAPDVDYLYVADIGDNASARASIIVYRVPEPTVSGSGTIALPGAVALEMTYPDGAHDAETLLSDPLTGDLFIVTKSIDGVSGIYRAATPHDEVSPAVLELVGSYTFPGNILQRLTTGGDISADGEAILVRTYRRAWLWPRDPADSVADAMANAPCEVPFAVEPQGEAAAFAADGSGYYTTSEQVDQPLYFFENVTPVPALSVPGGSLVVILLHAFGIRSLRRRDRTGSDASAR